MPAAAPRRSRATSSATTASSSTPTPRWSSPPAAPRRVAAALLGLVEPGDEVVVLEPYYDSYLAMIQVAGGVRRPVTLRAPDFRLDVDELRAAVTPRTRFVLLNSPHNPTGTVLTRDELAAVAEVAIEHDLVVITDEVYEHLVFTGHEHVPLRTLPGMAERTLTLSSAGKSWSFTGWKVGWATGPADAGRRRAGRQAVADLHLRLAAAARGRARPRRGAGLPAPPRRGPPGASRPAVRRARGRRAAGRVPEGTYFATTDISAPRAGPTAWQLLPRAARAGRRGGHPRPGLPRRPRRRAARAASWSAGRSARPREVIADGVARLAAADLHR